MNGEPLLLYVPGLKAKPPPGIHRKELLRCLVEGIRRLDAETAQQIRDSEHAFDIVGWNFDFYHEHRDIELDRAGIESVLKQQEASAEDKARAGTFKRRLLQWLYRAADRLPFLIPQIADENMQLHLRDLRRYVKNDNDIAEAARRLVKMPLRAAWQTGRPVLLIGHSMGSVIAYDALWQLSHESGDDLRVDLLLTMGSPLGMHYLQRRLQGCRESGARRFPANTRRWVNITAIGELTAIDMRLRNDYRHMIELGLVEDIEDYVVYNYFHQNGELNVHSEYGYLVNRTTAVVVRDWWRSVTSR
jgi:hypothetical protein